MFVFAQVSSMKTKRRGSIRSWYLRHCSRLRATSGRSCSLANNVFFEAESSFLQCPPDRSGACCDALIAELDRQKPHRHAGNRHALEQQIPVRRKRPPPVAADRQSSRRPSRPPPLRPLHHTRDAHPEQVGRLTAPAAQRDRCCNPLPKIIRISSDHPMPASNPASMLNQNKPPKGIPMPIQSSRNRL